jgi:hypothetical protein
MGNVYSYLFGTSTTQESNQQSLQQDITQSPTDVTSNESNECMFKFEVSPEDRKKLKMMADQLKSFTENFQFSAPWVDKQSGLEIRNAGTTPELEEGCRDFEGLKVLEKILREEPITRSDLIVLLPLIEKANKKEKNEKKNEEKNVVQYPTEHALKNILPEWIRTKEQLIAMPFFDLAVLKYRIDMWGTWIQGKSSTEYLYDIKTRPEDEKKEYELHQLANASMPWVKTATKTLETPYLWVNRIDFNPLPEDKDLQSCHKFIEIMRYIYTEYYFTILKNPNRIRSGFEIQILCEKDFFEKYIHPLGFEGTSSPEDVNDLDLFVRIQI